MKVLRDKKFLAKGNLNGLWSNRLRFANIVHSTELDVEEVDLFLLIMYMICNYTIYSKKHGLWVVKQY